MPEKWTGKIVGQLHVNGIKQKELANQMGVSKTWVTMVLNGKAKTPEGMEQRMLDAIDTIKEERSNATV